MRIREVPLDLPASTVSMMVLMALCDFPCESAGIIYKDGSFKYLPNMNERDPEHGIDIDDDLSDPRIDVFWHSHPGGLAWPSHQDVPAMQAVERINHIRWGIVNLDGVRMYEYQ